ncbi:MAG: thiamine phosphate synthase [Hyphomicrobiaceae bacterium]
MSGEDEPERCRISLTIDGGEGRPSDADLRQAIASGDVAAVVIRPPRSGADVPRLRILVKAIQSRDVAVMIADDLDLALATGADGLHLSDFTDTPQNEARFAAARRRLGADAILGAGVGLSRHDAMTAGELGASYVEFAIQGGDADADALAELTAWWSEVFEVPLVAGGLTRAAEAGLMAEAGADFVGLIAGPSDGLAGLVAAVEAAIA